MNRDTNSNTYTGVARSLHWLVGLGMIATFGVGVYMSDLPFSPSKLQIYSWHKWAGVTLFLLSVIRLAWRLTHQPPAAPEGMPAWQHAAAEWTHRILYALMFAIPLSGWLMSSAKGFQTVYFGLIPLPDLVSKNASLAEALGNAHGALNLAMIALVALHAAAALKHHLIDRDDVLVRMLPLLQRRAIQGVSK